MTFAPGWWLAQQNPAQRAAHWTAVREALAEEVAPPTPPQPAPPSPPPSAEAVTRASLHADDVHTAGLFPPRRHTAGVRTPSERAAAIAELADLLYRVQRLKPREIKRNPLGVSGPHETGDGSQPVFLFGGPCAGDEVTLPHGHYDYRVPIFRRDPIGMSFDSAAMSTRRSYDVARYRLQLDVCGLPARSTDGRQIFEFTGMEAA